MVGLSPDETLRRVCSLLRSQARGQFIQTVKYLGSRSAQKGEVQFWKQVFKGYDLDSSGELSYAELEHLVRVGLKVSQKALPDAELRRCFEIMDQNGDQILQWEEWLDAVKCGTTPDKRPAQEVLVQLGRAVRLALTRNGWRLHQLVEAMMDRTMNVPYVTPQGLMTLDSLRSFFRKSLRLSTQQCPDDQIKTLFQSASSGTEGLVSLAKAEDVINSLHDLLSHHEDFRAQHSREMGHGPPLLAGARGLLSPRRLQRPGTLPMGGTGQVCGPTALPFCLNGRELPPSSRLAVNLPPALRPRQPPPFQRTGVPSGDPWARPQTVATMDGVASEAFPGGSKHAHSDGGDSPKSVYSTREPPSPSNRFGSDRPGSPMSPNSPMAATMPAGFSLPPVKAKPRRRPARSQSYMVVQGAECLNRVEALLFKAGIDVRGGLHRNQSAPNLKKS